MTRYRQVAEEVAAHVRAAGREPGSVTLVAVSKTVGLDAIADAIEQGATDFGENRPEPLEEKSLAFPQVRWHFIGNIQSRRIPTIVAHAYLIHSLSHHHHAEAIAKAALALGKVQKVLVEVNVTGEASKSGLTPEEAPEFVDYVQGLEGIEVCGLMTMAPIHAPELAQEAFEGLADLRRRIADRETGLTTFNQLSMGMSDDWPYGVEAGATIVRIGRAIFDDNYQEVS